MTIRRLSALYVWIEGALVIAAADHDSACGEAPTADELGAGGEPEVFLIQGSPVAENKFCFGYFDRLPPGQRPSH